MGLFDKIRFNADGLIPAIIYDVEDNRPLTLCYMNREALEATINSGKVHVFRRSKGRLMLKGEQSGHVQEVVDLAIDCEGKSLAIKVRQHVAACHHGYRSCYYRIFDPKTGGFRIDDERVFDPKTVY